MADEEHYAVIINNVAHHHNNRVYSFYVCVLLVEAGQYAGGGLAVAYFAWVHTALHGSGFGGAITSDTWYGGGGGLGVTLLYVVGVGTCTIL